MIDIAPKRFESGSSGELLKKPDKLGRRLKSLGKKALEIYLFGPTYHLQKREQKEQRKYETREQEKVRAFKKEESEKERKVRLQIAKIMAKKKKSALAEALGLEEEEE
ncbi:MAG: hypothetical protein QME51_04230 [Planctomycetota bacterium]|nr:hypothetical protein [Planctomycetota bacterium]